MSKCENCLWFDQCHTLENTCDDYVPVNEDWDVEAVIEEGKYEFRHVFGKYLEEYI